MAVEFYNSDQSRVSRLFPIFFGKRADVFGKIGNLFKEDEFLLLPEVVPTASLELAAKLLRLNGVEPRPEMASMTIARIVNDMKKFLCVFAWNIESPELVISESVDQILQVLRQSLSEVKDSSGHEELNGHSSQHRPAVSASATALSTSCSLPLKRCVEILRENLGIETTAMTQVVADSLDALADDDVRARCEEHKSLVAKAQYLVGDVLGIME